MQSCSPAVLGVMLAADIRHSTGAWRSASFIDINWLLTQLYGATQLKTKIQTGAESLILSPGRFVVQIISVVAHQSHNPLRAREP